MTVVVQARDRCRLCFSLILRDRSICCQKSYHLFKPIERRRLPALKPCNAHRLKLRSRTVCFQDLIRRYLRTGIQQTRTSSNFICSACSTILLDIEQCDTYLRKTINQVKVKLNKSTRLLTSSLSATFQKKRSSDARPIVKEEQRPVSNSESDNDDDEFDDVDDDEEEFDEETKPGVSENVKPSKSLPFVSPFSSGADSSLSLSRSKTAVASNCDYEDDDDDEEEDGLVKSPEKNLSDFIQRLQTNARHMPNGSLPAAHPTMNILEETNPQLLQMRLAQMMAQPLNDHSQADSMMNRFTNIQRHFFLQFLNDPMAAAQAAQAAAAAMSANQAKGNASVMMPTGPLNGNSKQASSGRKRKSTPEKRVLTNHHSSANNGDVSLPAGRTRACRSSLRRHLPSSPTRTCTMATIIHWNSL